MGGSPTMEDILLRMSAQIYREPRTMSTTVKLTDRKTGEDYVFEYKDAYTRWGDSTFSLVNDAIKQLRKEWPANV